MSISVFPTFYRKSHFKLRLLKRDILFYIRTTIKNSIIKSETSTHCSSANYQDTKSCFIKVGESETEVENRHFHLKIYKYLLFYIYTLFISTHWLNTSIQSMSTKIIFSYLIF